VLTGFVPPLAPFYLARQETGSGLSAGLRPGETTLLVPALPGTGGTGKTQLAVGFAHTLWAARAVDLLAWIPAGNRSAVIAGYAQAATDLELLSAEEAAAGTADTAARRFLDWLRRTERRWAVVLDGVVSPVDIDGLWPQGPAGQAVVTSRLRESELGGPAPGNGVTVHAVHGFSRREALGYLNARLTNFPDQRIEALDLAEDLGGLPIALAQAAAVITVAQTSCREYRAEFERRLSSVTGMVVDGCPQALLATWSLAVEHAHELPPPALSWPALVFASAFDTGGIPAAVLTSPAACTYITGQRDPQLPGPGPSSGQHRAGPYRPGQHGTEGAAQSLVRAAYANLERLGLLSVDTTNKVRTVWLQAAVRAAIRAYLAQGNAEQVITAAAAALLEAWPPAGAPGSGPQLSQALRDSAAALRECAGDLLWKPDAHPLLLRAGASLTEAPALTDSAVGYWQVVGDASNQLLGYGHAQSVLARERLADAYAAGGRLAEALSVFEATLADREATLGPHHQETVAARLNAARSLHAAGREPEAIALYEQVLAARERVLGPGHRDTLTVRVQLAAACEAAGRHGDSIKHYERALSDAERELGADHGDTLSTRVSLAGAYLAAGRARDAVAAYERALADQDRVAGADSPGTLAARASLVGAYRAAGRAKEAVSASEQVLADRERLLGPDHLDTVAARGNLGYAYRTAGRLKDAIPQYERVVADRERIMGPGHPDALAARAILGAAYQQARRLREAIEVYERVVADSEAVLGPGDIDTLTTRCNLATAYYEAGRMTDGIRVLRAALADCERYLGRDHPMTSTVRENLQAATE
jgi:tetratricopeptide (TPR) repeat protein